LILAAFKLACQLLQRLVLCLLVTRAPKNSAKSTIPTISNANI
jgi:hypothetical protein